MVKAAAPPKGFIDCLAAVAKELRESAGVRHVHIAAKADVDQSTVYKFEKGRWIRNPELIVGAYSEVCDASPADLWNEASRRFAGQARHLTVSEILSARDLDPLRPIVDQAEEAGQVKRRSR